MKINREFIIFIISAIIITGIIASWPYFASERQHEILKNQEYIIKRQAENNHTSELVLEGIDEIKKLLLLNDSGTN